MSNNKIVGRVDPLEMLKQAYLNKKKIKQKDQYLVFENNIKLSLFTQTPWLSPTTKKQYSLGSIWLFLQDNLKKIDNYFQKVAELKVDAVTFTDRDEMIKYFIQGAPNSPCINEQLKLQLMHRANKRDASQMGGEMLDQMGGKKVKLDKQIPRQLQVIDCLTKFQKPTSSKNRSLRHPDKTFQTILQSLKESQENPNNADRIRTRLSYFFEKKRLPIIIVPEVLVTGNISIHNIEKFLTKGQYDAQHNAFENNPHVRKIQLEHYIRGKRVLFEVTSNPSLLSYERDWEYVVAIFVQGRKSEFESWPVTDPVKIFKNAKGFLMKFQNLRTDQANQWNIRTLILDKNTRYRDGDLQKFIWDEIQKYLMQRI